MKRLDVTSQSGSGADTPDKKACKTKESTEMRKAEFTSSDSNEEDALAKANNEIATPTLGPPKSSSADIIPFRMGDPEPSDLEKV